MLQVLEAVASREATATGLAIHASTQGVKEAK